ncbi:MAG: hypothetical protein IPM42_13490 [Saprospiraceae bacterium]|nr:hypothetical protein [Saprospiraceae bacterium]
MGTSQEINCGEKNLEILVSDKTNNEWITYVLNYNKIAVGSILNKSNIFHSMEFYFQPKVYFATIIDTAFSFAPPIIGFVKFSDIIISENGYYYLNCYIVNRFLCEQFDEILHWSNSYTYEIERCTSGFLRFKRIIVGQGEMSSSHGAISTIEILKDTEECR